MKLDAFVAGLTVMEVEKSINRFETVWCCAGNNCNKPGSIKYPGKNYQIGGKKAGNKKAGNKEAGTRHNNTTAFPPNQIAVPATAIKMTADRTRTTRCFSSSFTRPASCGSNCASMNCSLPASALLMTG